MNIIKSLFSVEILTLINIIKSLFSVEILTLIVVQLFSYLGIVRNNSKNIEQMKEQHSHELTKFELQNNAIIERENNDRSREFELKKLNKAYKPIIALYERSDTNKYIMNVYMGEELPDKGVNTDVEKKVTKIVEENYELFSISLIKKYENAYASMIEDDVTYTQGNDSINYGFDYKGKFINAVRQEAEKIEEKFK